jgi:hypothetical protein
MRLRRIYAKFNPRLAPGFLNPASGGLACLWQENDLTGSSQSLFVSPPLCRLFESDMHAGSRRKGDKHFEAKSFPFASDQV